MKDIFELEECQPGGEGKIAPLGEAIEKSIRPGMTIHINVGAYPNAAIREILRQFWGTNPGFTLVTAGVTTPFEIGFTCSGLVKKVITTNHSYVYPTPRPIPLLLKMEKEGRLQIESWSLYSLEQRLMAAAWGVGFLPTKSLIGTDLGEENASAFQMMSDPFDKDRKIGVVRALTPDISFIHGCIADREGNVVLAPPYFASIWGSRASKGGVIATVEKIVPSEVIRQHSALVKLPAQMVRFVCPIPFGAHPQGLASESIGLSDGYGEDYEFVLDSVHASADEGKLKEWLDKWTFHCSDHDSYLNCLGPAKLSFLRGRSSADAWRYDMLGPASREDSPAVYNATEWMVVAAARVIREVIEKKGYNAMLAGIGSPGLAAWLAYYFGKKEGKKIQMLTGVGQMGYSPRPGDPFLMSLSNVMTCSMLTDTVEVYGTFVGGANSRCLSVIGTAQVDQYGNINTVKIDGSSFIGVGGAGDAVNAPETLVVAKQARSRFMPRVPYIGCSGKKVRTLVTDLGVFQKMDDDDTFTLTKVLRDPGKGTMEAAIQEVKARCGWECKIADSLFEVAPPTPEELSLLHALDPKGLFIGKN